MNNDASQTPKRKSRPTAVGFSRQLVKLQEVTNRLSKANSFDELCRQAIELGRSQLGFDRLSLWFGTGDHQTIVGSFGTDEHGQIRDERNQRLSVSPDDPIWNALSYKESVLRFRNVPLSNDRGEVIGQGEKAFAPLWNGDEVVGVLSADNLFTQQPITDQQIEIHRLYATTLGYLCTQKQAEMALKVSRERLAEAQQIAHLGNWELTFDPPTVVWSEEVYRIFGVDPQVFQPSLEAFLEQIHPEDRERMQVIFRELLTTPGPHSYDYRILRPNGEVREVNEQVIVFQDNTGATIRFVGVVIDITERKQAEAALHKQARLNEALFDQAISCFTLLDTDFRFLRVNEAFARYYKKKPEEFAGRSYSEVIPYEGSSTSRQEILETVLREKKPLQAWARPYVFEDQPERGITYWDWILQPILNTKGEVECFFFSSIDVTERTQAQTALEESQRFLHRVMDTTPDNIFVLDIAERRILYMNRSIFDMLGYTAEEILAMGSDVGPRLVHPDDRAAILQRYTTFETMRDDEIVEYEFRVQAANGEWHSVQSRDSIFLRDPEGKPLQVIGVARDITDRKRLEAQLLQSQKMEGIGRLAGGIAHDFNNLLTVILGYTELALMTLPEDAPQGSNLQQVKKAADRAADLTRQLLAFARKQIIEPKVLNLNTLILELDKLLQRLIGEDIELVTIPAPDLWGVKADAGQFEQVLINLCVNARDAMPEGGKLTVETANVTLDAEYARQHTEVIPGDYVMLAVSDTGLGMNATTQQHIFEPFFTTKETGKGTGLGLATCHGIVKQSGGHIWLYSEPGQGTTFKIYLPRVLESTLPSSPKEEVVSPEGSETILLVEDEVMVRMYAAEALRGHGYTVLEAAGGAEALTLAAGYVGTIHLLMTDVVMPQMSGRQLAEQLATLRPETKILYASGYTDNTIVHHGILEAGVAFVQKPYAPDVLARKVRETLDAAP